MNNTALGGFAGGVAMLFGGPWLPNLTELNLSFLGIYSNFLFLLLLLLLLTPSNRKTALPVPQFQSLGISAT